MGPIGVQKSDSPEGAREEKFLVLGGPAQSAARRLGAGDGH